MFEAISAEADRDATLPPPQHRAHGADADEHHRPGCRFGRVAEYRDGITRRQPEIGAEVLVGAVFLDVQKLARINRVRQDRQAGFAISVLVENIVENIEVVTVGQGGISRLRAEEVMIL